MSGQNTLLVIAEDAQVKRPGSTWNWQVYRDTAAAGSGTYKAMNSAGVVEIIGGPSAAANTQLSVAITYVEGTRVLTATPAGGTVGVNSYVWRIASESLGEANMAFTGASTTNTQTLAAAVATANGLVEVKVTDSLGRVAYGTFFVREVVVVP